MNLREQAKVSEECMNMVYEVLRNTKTDHMARMFLIHEPNEPLTTLMCYQIGYVMSKRAIGDASWQYTEQGN